MSRRAGAVSLPAPQHAPWRHQQRLPQGRPHHDICVAPRAVGLDTALLASTPPALQDALMFVLAAVGAKAWTKLFDVAVSAGLFDQV